MNLVDPDSLQGPRFPRHHDDGSDSGGALVWAIGLILAAAVVFVVYVAM